MGGGWLVGGGMGLSRFWGGDELGGMAFMSGCDSIGEPRHVGWNGVCRWMHLMGDKTFATYTQALSFRRLFERLFFISCFVVVFIKTILALVKSCFCMAYILCAAPSVEFGLG